MSLTLCRLISSPIVRSILEIDFEFLKNEFINVYMKGDKILYISPYNKDGKTIDIRDTDTWREH